MAANKVKGVRCGIAYNDEVAKLMRQHNDANVISFGQKFMELNDVLKRVDIFLSTEFEGGRHQTRVDMISSLEEKQLKIIVEETYYVGLFSYIKKVVRI